MKRILSLISLIITWQIGFSQSGTTIANNLQVTSTKGAPPATAMPTNGGLAYIDVNGMIRKSSIPGLLGKKVDSAQRLNDSTLRFTTINGTYDVTIRGLYDVKTKTWVDSVHAGLYRDTTLVQNKGSGNTQIASVSGTNDTLILATLRDSNDIKYVKNADGSISAYLSASGVAAGTYGDGTHVAVIQIDGNGRVKLITLSAIPSATTNLSTALSASADTIKSSTGTPAVLPTAVAGQTAGITTAAKQARYDSLVTIANSGHGKPLLRSPSTQDSLIARGVSTTGSGRVVSTYTGNNDSVSYDISLINGPHTIFTPTTGQTVALANNRKNIINPAGTISTLTITLPSSPANNDEVIIKFTQTVTTITYSGGTIAGGVSTQSAGTMVTLTFDSGTSAWY